MSEVFVSQSTKNLIALCIEILAHELADQEIPIGGCATNSAEAGNVAREVLRILNITPKQYDINRQINLIAERLEEIGQ